MGVQNGHLPRKRPKWPKVARLGTVSTEVFDGLKFPGFGGLHKGVKRHQTHAGLYSLGADCIAWVPKHPQNTRDCIAWVPKHPQNTRDCIAWVPKRPQNTGQNLWKTPGIPKEKQSQHQLGAGGRRSGPCHRDRGKTYGKHKENLRKSRANTN